MKKVRILALAVIVACAGCQNAGTLEQQEAARLARGKNIAKLEKRAWSLGSFLANLAGNVLVNSATNYVNEKFNTGGSELPRTTGFRK